MLKTLSAREISTLLALKQLMDHVSAYRTEYNNGAGFMSALIILEQAQAQAWVVAMEFLKVNENELSELLQDLRGEPVDDRPIVTWSKKGSGKL